MEALLHLVWQQRLWTSLRAVRDLEGCDIEVIDVGICNHDAGPDFYEAKIRIGDILWVGAVEIHQYASEWLRHEHHFDKNYTSVILHVVEYDDAPIYAYGGKPLPTVVVEFDDELRARAEYLVQYARFLPCSPLVPRLEDSLLYAHLQFMSKDRLIQKAEHIRSLGVDLDWYEALYVTTMRYFGSDLNNDTMEALARCLPYKLLMRYVSNPLQFDALLIGQAGLIDQVPESEFKVKLVEEYRFLSIKHQLSSIDPKLWKLARRRPQNHPLRRLLQLSSILRNRDFTPTAFVALNNLKAFAQFFTPVDIENYWFELYRTEDLGFSRQMLYNLIINIIIPFTLALKGDGYLSLALEELGKLPVESNKIARLFLKAGVSLRHAADSQAVIQIYKTYCLPRKCLYCPWGRQLLAKP